MSLSDEVAELAAVGATSSTPRGWEAGAEVTGDAGTVTSGPVTEPVRDWSSLMALWGLDADHFEVVEPVTFKAWDGFAKEQNADGTQTVVSQRLFSYKAQIRRRGVMSLELSALAKQWRHKLLKVKPAATPRPRPGSVTYLVAVADPQIGKKRTAEALENWRRGVEAHCARIRRILDEGHHTIGQIAVCFQGDETEGVANNYANQPYTVEMSFSEQIETDFNMRVWTIEQFARLGIPLLVTSVYSNHGEWTRNGSKDVVTSKADNASTCVARLVRELIVRLPNMGHVSFEIAESSPDLIVELSGVRTLLSHGHIAKGRGSSSEQRTKNAIERQILGRTTEMHDVTLFVVAHYHHFYMLEFEGRTLFGCPALEAEKSSEYMLEQYGVWSPPGMLGMLVGSGLGRRGWASLDVA